MFTNLLKWLGKNKGVAEGLGVVISAVLPPAIGIYLRRSLLSANGAIMSVFSGYKRLILGQTQEQATFARTDAALAKDDRPDQGSVCRRSLAVDDLVQSLVGGGKSSSLSGIGSLLGKAGAGGMTAMALTPLLNQYLGPTLKKHGGRRARGQRSSPMLSAER